MILATQEIYIYCHWVMTYAWLLSLVWLSVTPWIVACQAPLPVGILQPRVLEWVTNALLQGIVPTQRSNPDLPHCVQILYWLRHQGSPGTLEWVAYPFSRGSSQRRNQTGVSCIAGRFFTSWAIRKAHQGITILIAEDFMYHPCDQGLSGLEGISVMTAFSCLTDE